jgi:hypothetical protein
VDYLFSFATFAHPQREEGLSPRGRHLREILENDLLTL